MAVYGKFLGPILAFVLFLWVPVAQAKDAGDLLVRLRGVAFLTNTSGTPTITCLNWISPIFSPPISRLN